MFSNYVKTNTSLPNAIVKYADRYTQGHNNDNFDSFRQGSERIPYSIPVETSSYTSYTSPSLRLVYPAPSEHFRDMRAHIPSFPTSDTYRQNSPILYSESDYSKLSQNTSIMKDSHSSVYRPDLDRLPASLSLANYHSPNPSSQNLAGPRSYLIPDLHDRYSSSSAQITLAPYSETSIPYRQSSSNNFSD